MTAFVLDCSIAVTWCFDDEASDEADALLDRLQEQGAAVPSLFPLELGNILALAERRGRIPASGLSPRLELLATLPIEVDPNTAAMALRETLTLARRHSLTTYDASYLELALRLGLPLASTDRALRRAAIDEGVVVLP